MKTLLFTNNSARHISFIELMANNFDEVYVIQECNTLFPGQVDDFFRKSDVMKDYFTHVMSAEKEVFGEPRFLPKNVTTMALHYEDISLMPARLISEALEADAIVSFGASWIKGELIEILTEKKAVNIHMGIAPFYRGHSSNFWALYDGRPDMVGATVHRLTKGLDSGAIIRHAFPKAEAVDPFVFGMKAVKAGHESVIDFIKTGQITQVNPIKQDKELELRYTRGAMFTDEIATEYLNNSPSLEMIESGAEKRDLSKLIRPYEGQS